MRNAVVKQCLDDGDVPMSHGSNNSRQAISRGRGGHNFGRGRNSPLPHGDGLRGNRHSIIPSDTNWYKIHVSTRDSFSSIPI